MPLCSTTVPSREIKRNRVREREREENNSEIFIDDQLVRSYCMSDLIQQSFLAAWVL